MIKQNPVFELGKILALQFIAIYFLGILSGYLIWYLRNQGDMTSSVFYWQSINLE